MIFLHCVADEDLDRLSEKMETTSGEFKKIIDYFMFKGEGDEEVIWYDNVGDHDDDG